MGIIVFAVCLAASVIGGICGIGGGGGAAGAGAGIGGGASSTMVW